MLACVPRAAAGAEERRWDGLMTTTSVRWRRIRLRLRLPMWWHGIDFADSDYGDSDGDRWSDDDSDVDQKTERRTRRCISYVDLHDMYP